jgi:hypothetical protein
MTRVCCSFGGALPGDFPGDAGLTSPKFGVRMWPCNCTKMTQLFEITEDKLRTQVRRDYLQIDSGEKRNQKSSRGGWI